MTFGEPPARPLPPARRVTALPPRPVGARRSTPSRRPADETPPAPTEVPAPPRHRARVEPRSVELPSLRQALLSEPEAVTTATMPIRRVLVIMALAFAIALLFSGRGIVHAGEGMNDGIERTVTLAIGQPLVDITSAVGLTAPWDRAEVALGRANSSSVHSLLTGTSTASGTGTPARNHTAGPSGAKQPAATSTQHSKPPTVKHVALPVPTRAHPLRLLVTGDSLTEYLGPQLVDEAAQAGPVKGFTDTHYGTGLVRPDFVDWSVVAQQQETQYHPNAVVVMIGGNDFQNMTMPNGHIIDALTPAWTREYQRRAEIVMRVWARHGAARVYWLSMPPAREPSWSQNDANIDTALQRAARQVPGVKYLNILGPVTNHGKYADFVYVNGQATLVRTQDGIHFTETGSQLIANEMLTTLERDWKFGKFAGKSGKLVKKQAR
jgi:uncharacterized protein